MAEVIIEVMGHHGITHEIKKFGGGKVSIGRGYENDLIISDKHVSGKQMVIHLDPTGWILEDLSSENGTFLLREGKKIDKILIQSGDEIIVGRTHLRIFSADHPIEHTKHLVDTSKFVKTLGHPLFAFGIFFVTLGFSILQVYMTSWKDLSLPVFGLGLIGVILLVMIWAGIWAFIGRLIRHRAGFLTQLSIICIYSIFASIVNEMIAYLSYMTNSPLVSFLGSIVWLGGLFILLLIWNLGIATNLSFQKRLIGSAVTVFVGVIFVTLSYFVYKDEFNSVPEFHSILKPPFAKVLKNQPIDKFLADSREIFNIPLEKGK